MKVKRKGEGMVTETSGIPPIEPQMTTIATNITQTPQTPLDQKVALKQQEKVIEKSKNKKAKDQVAINQQQQIILKERREMKRLRELQIVVLFSQLMIQGLAFLEENANSLIYLLTIDELKKSHVRQELPVLFLQLRQLLQKNLKQLEQQQQALYEQLPSAIQQTSTSWQIKNGKRAFEYQQKCFILEAMLDTLHFPDTSADEEKIRKLEVEQEKNQVQQQEEAVQLENNQSQFRQLKKHLEQLSKQQIEKRKVEMKWAEKKREKQQEEAEIQVLLAQMLRIHPLKRKQHEYQAHLLREKLVQQEIRQIENEYVAIQLELQNLDKIMHLAKERITEMEYSVNQQLGNTVATKEQGLRIQREIQVLTEKYQKYYQTSYNEIRIFFEEQLRQLSNERALAEMIEVRYRLELSERLLVLKQALKNSHHENGQRLEILQRALNQAPSTVLLSQANAKSTNVQQILTEKNQKKI